MSTNGHLKFQGTNRATFVGETSNIMFDTTTTSLGIGVTGTDHPSSNLYITGNAYISNSISVGGVLTMGTVNVVARHDLEAVTAMGNTTPLTIEFSNATTGIVTTGNVEVGGELTVSGNVEVGTANLFVDTTTGRVGIGTTSADNALHIRNAIPAVLLDDSDDNTKVRITGGTGGDLYVDSNWGGSGNTGDIIFREASSEKMRITGSGNVGVGTSVPDKRLHVYTGAGEGNTQLHLQSADRYSTIQMLDDTGAILFGNDRGAMRFITGYDTSLSGGSEAMRILSNRNVGVGTTNPGRKLEVYTGNGAVPGLRLRRYPTGATYTDFQHADSSSPANSKEGLAITVGDGNVTAQEVMRICGDGFVGINTTNPHRTLDVQAPARPSGMPFAIGGSWNNRAYYVAKEFSPGVNKSSYTIDFLIGGSERPGWLRACAGGSQSGSGTLGANAIAEFIISPYGTNFYSSRRLGDSAISVGSSGTHNGGRITVSHGHTSYPRLWFEIYHPYGVYW
jgi:hypothetical protein